MPLQLDLAEIGGHGTYAVTKAGSMPNSGRLRALTRGEHVRTVSAIGESQGTQPPGNPAGYRCNVIGPVDVQAG